MDNNNGPNMTPMNPNKESPMTTPKMVMSGWVSAIFFCRIKRMRLSTVSYTHLFITAAKTKVETKGIDSE